MKEILFRAKRLEDEKWVEGFYYKMNETTYAFADDYEKNPVPTHHYILFERMTDWGLPNQMYQVEVDGKTVCQYTGLTDKNGRNIFERDIVKTSQYGVDGSGHNYAGFDTFSIEFLDGGFCLKNKWRRFNFRPLGNFEVIGNIFDNPKLL